jgi:hypothetical protein
MSEAAADDRAGDAQAMGHRAFLDEPDVDLARPYQKYCGDASFAQPADPSARGKTESSSEGR